MSSSSSSSSLSWDDTPSRQAGISAEEETMLRIRMAINIMAGCRMLEMSDAATYASVGVFQQFFMYRAFSEYDHWLIAQASVAVGAKATEEQRKMRDIINVMHRVRHPQQHGVPAMDKAFFHHKKVLIGAEQVVLRVLKLDLAAAQPFRYLYNFLAALDASVQLTRLARCVANDTAIGTVCLEYQSEEVAAACVVLASQLLQHAAEYARARGADTQEANAEDVSRVGFVEGLHDWLDVVGVDKGRVLEIGERMMDTYELLEAEPELAGAPPTQFLWDGTLRWQDLEQLWQEHAAQARTSSASSNSSGQREKPSGVGDGKERQRVVDDSSKRKRDDSIGIGGSGEENDRKRERVIASSDG